ncbi:hypothetical protein OsI_07712 [Oryza sativa Indica Group]|uniref:Uncharacterized protein n=1 Tax=Oryza sativa subsp. indica TaxID=39946 RepID=B8AE05_ORYSI|nr:hypothetical protein OsI_07712 [Oryza sativa Indica Group]
MERSSGGGMEKEESTAGAGRRRRGGGAGGVSATKRAVTVGGDAGRAPPGRGRCRRRGVEVDAPCASSSTTRSSSGRAPWRAPSAVAFTFFTQSCAVNVVYGHAWCGRVHVPVETGAIALIGLPALELEGLPWFIKVGPGPYPAYFDLVMKQFDRLELADDVLVNSFYEFEPELS